MGCPNCRYRAVIAETDYDAQVEATYAAIEQALDAVDSDLDYETGGGVLTVEFANGTTMVFSRQAPVRELWLACRAGGFHFRYDAAAGDWCDTRDGAALRPFLVAQMREQAGIDFTWA